MTTLSVFRNWTTENLAICAKECSRIDKMDDGRQRLAQGSYWRGQSVAYSNLLSVIDELESHDEYRRCIDVTENCFGDIGKEACSLCDAMEVLRKISKMTPENASIYTAVRLANDALG